MDRNDEFIKLKKELEQTPPELESIPSKAIIRARKQRRRSMLWKTPLVSFCSIAIIFILLVNMFPAVALAMSNIPFLKDLVSAVAFDPSLKLAVENDYVQIIDESQTKDDVKVTIEYMILDAGHITLFFRVDAPVKAGIWNFDFRTLDGKGLSACIGYDTMYEVGQLEAIQIDFVDGNYLIPEEFNLNLTINKDETFEKQRSVEMTVPNTSEVTTPTTTPQKAGIDYNFSFTLHPDKEFSQTLNTLPIDQWIEIKGQRIHLNKLDIFPTQARLYLDFDDSNSAVIERFDIYFEDENGKIYDTRKNGVSATGNPKSFDIRSLHFESSYFTKAEHLKLCINAISMIEKDEMYGVINFADKAVTNLPEGVSIDKMELSDSTLDLTFKVRSDIPNAVYEIISSTYYDLDGKEYFFGSWDTGSEECFYYPHYRIKDYEDNKYKLRWTYSPMQQIDKPVIINLY